MNRICECERAGLVPPLCGLQNNLPAMPPRSIGHPIVGDTRYASASPPSERILLHAQLLHLGERVWTRV